MKNNLFLYNDRVKRGRNLLRLKALTPLFQQTLFTTILTDLNHGVLSPAATFFGIDSHLVSIATDIGPRVGAWTIRHRLRGNRRR